MGLRERKKEQTRQAIEDAAFRLFEERGYQATTVADIADAADISPRTFFAYFSSKEAVVFCNMEDDFPVLEAHLRGRPDGETTFESLRSWIHERVVEGEGDRDHVRKRLITENEALAAQQRHMMARFETLIAECVAADLGEQPGDLRPRLVAAAAIAALMSLGPHDPEDHEQLPVEEAMALIDQTFAFLQGGIDAL